MRLCASRVQAFVDAQVALLVGSDGDDQPYRVLRLVVSARGWKWLQNRE